MAEIPEKYADLSPLIAKRNGAAELTSILPSRFRLVDDVLRPEEISVWEQVGLVYKEANRWHEAILVFQLLYRQLLLAQSALDVWLPKGMPLVYTYDCYEALGCASLAKRYLMLTLCEDAISWKGQVDPESSGSYFRLIWASGLSDDKLRLYSQRAFDLWLENPSDARFPEWILQQLDSDWLVEPAVPQEFAYNAANPLYVKHLADGLGDKSGKRLELLAEYLLSTMPGCRTARRGRSPSTDYDIVCSIEGVQVDFRSELGRYFLCECKDWATPADFAAFAKFARVLESVKSRFGVLFSRFGITGEGSTQAASREQLKVYQDKGMVIAVIDEGDVRAVIDGANFSSTLRRRYEEIRLDLNDGG